jgi:hypothetical protein
LPQPSLGSAGGLPPGPAGSEVISSLEDASELDAVSLVVGAAEVVVILDELLVGADVLDCAVVVVGLAEVTGLTDGVTGGVTADETG